MKKSFLSLVIIAVLLMVSSVSIVFATSFSDLTNPQIQKYWSIIKEDCVPLLATKNYTDYRTCALNAFETAANYQESTAWCNDSDGGMDFFQKGIVYTDLRPNGITDYVYTFSNGKTYLMEGMCSSTNRYYYIQKNCSEFGSKYYSDAEAGTCVYVNTAPVLMIAAPTFEIEEGENYEIFLYGSDEDGDDLTFSGQNLPDGAVIDEEVAAPLPWSWGDHAALFSWTPSYEQAGEYKFTLTVTDGEQEDSLTLNVSVVNAGDTEAPIITLIGTDPVEVQYGVQYVDAGATAFDNVDGYITASIVVGGDIVDTNTSGFYVITYNVSDSSGNAAMEATRTINVLDPELSSCLVNVYKNVPYSSSLYNGFWSNLLDFTVISECDAVIESIGFELYGAYSKKIDGGFFHNDWGSLISIPGIESSVGSNFISEYYGSQDFVLFADEDNSFVLKGLFEGLSYVDNDYIQVKLFSLILRDLSNDKLVIWEQGPTYEGDIINTLLAY